MAAALDVAGSPKRGVLKRTESSTVWKDRADDGDRREMMKVFLSDGSYKSFRLDPAEITVEALWEVVCEKLELSEEAAQAFFLFGVNGNFELLLFTHQTVADVRRDWHIFEERYNPKLNRNTLAKTLSRKFIKKKNSDMTPDQEIQAALEASKLTSKWEFKFVLRTTAVLPLADECKLTEDAAVSLFFAQAAHNVVKSNYPCDLETATTLAGLHVQAVFGDYQPAHHSLDFMEPAVDQFVPEHLLKHVKREEWAEILITQYKAHGGLSKRKAQLQYLKIVRRWDYYGSTFFFGKYEPLDSLFTQEFEGIVRVGVNYLGLHIIDPKVMKIVTCPFEQLISWNSDKQLFWFEMSPNKSISGKKTLSLSHSKKPKVHQIKSPQAELINDLLHDWSAEIDRSHALAVRKDLERIENERSRSYSESSQRNPSDDEKKRQAHNKVRRDNAPVSKTRAAAANQDARLDSPSVRRLRGESSQRRRSSAQSSAGSVSSRASSSSTSSRRRHHRRPDHQSSEQSNKKEKAVAEVTIASEESTQILKSSVDGSDESESTHSSEI